MCAHGGVLPFPEHRPATRVAINSRPPSTFLSQAAKLMSLVANCIVTRKDLKMFPLSVRGDLFNVHLISASKRCDCEGLRFFSAIILLRILLAFKQEIPVGATLRFKQSTFSLVVP